MKIDSVREELVLRSYIDNELWGRQGHYPLRSHVDKEGC